MEPLSIAAISWGVTATGWFVSPYITRLLDKAYAHIKPGEQKVIIRSMNETLQRVKLILEAAEGSGHKARFEQLLKDLKSAFYDTESMVNEVEYIRRFKSGEKRKGLSDWVMKVGLPGRRPKNCTKVKLDITIGEHSSSQAVATLSSSSVPGPLRRRLKDTLTKIEELIKSAHETLELLELQRNIGSVKHIQNVPANSINMCITSDPTGKVTGREDAIKEIREMLRRTEGTERLSVIGIIGIPGSGKTTLAQCVCQSERSDNYFDIVMWIHVSENFTVGTIYGEMFEQAWKKFHGTQEIHKYDGTDAVKDELKMVLNGKLILLILDDIWFGNTEDTTSDQELIKIFIPLVHVKRQSKILMTSRQNSLLRLGADVACTTYSIPDLGDEVFLKLFMHYALDDNRVNEQDIEEIKQIGAEIALKLKKSPLFARVVGSSLFRKRKIEIADWRSVRDQNLLDKNMGSLWCTYQHLGEQVRRCFAYCSIFPRRYVLRRYELVNLWVAEGFVDSTNIGHEMENVARGYFDELISSSFLLLGGKDDDGEEYFVIHDLLYDLAVKVAGDDCFKIENSWTSEVPVNVRHLSIQSCTPSMVSKHIVKLKKLRTLIIYKFEEGFFSIKDEHSGVLKFEDGRGFQNMFRQLSELRVLIFATDTDSNAYLSFSFPKYIGFLKYLRYLGVHRKLGYQEVTLPDTVEKLYLLQVLDFGGAMLVHSSFSEDLIKLADLRRVYNKCRVSFPNMGRLASLRTIPRLDVLGGDGHELYQLEHLNNLEGKLIIDGLRGVKTKDEALNAKLAQKKLLTELELSWNDAEWRDTSVDLRADVLEALRPPDSITYLKLDCYDCSRYPTWMVGTKESTIHLSKLVLSLCRRPICGPEHFFLRVSSLTLKSCHWDTLPDMKHLTSLELGSCSMPSSLENLTSLERLVVYQCFFFTVPALPRSLRYMDISAYGCGESEDQIFEKVKHIPHIVLFGKEFKAPATKDFKETGSGGRGGLDGSGSGLSTEIRSEDQHKGKARYRKKKGRHSGTQPLW